MSGDTEEKKHLPTQTKLRRARRDGRVAHSRDVVALATLPTLLWVFFNWPSFERQLKHLVQIAFTQDYNASVEHIAGKLVPGIAQLTIDIAAPFLLVATLMGIVLSVADTGGFVFSLKPIAPDFSRINPAEGFKRIFSARTAVESGFALLKLLVFAGVTVAILWAALDTLRRVQVCGLRCLPESIDVTIIPILATFIALFLVLAVIDFLMSRALFRHEMRMSDTELKRENKDVYGNPEVRRRRRDEGRSILGGPARLGAAEATLVVSGPDGVIGLRYVPNETQAPVVVAKGRGPRASAILETARVNGIPVAVNPDLASLLTRRGYLGDYVPAESFTEVATEIIRHTRG